MNFIPKVKALSADGEKRSRQSSEAPDETELRDEF